MDPSQPAPPEPAADATALVVLVPDAEAAIGNIRDERNLASVDGMPAHVTVLYPFISEAEWRYAGRDERPDVRLARVFRGFEPFDAAFRRTARFGTTTLYVVPEPSERFSELTRAVATEFPAWPPYGGAHAVVIPHLTVADHVTPDVLDACDALIVGELPFTARIAEVALFGRRDGLWTRLKAWPLGTGAREPAIVLRGEGPDFVRLSVERYEFGVSDAESADWLVARAHVAVGTEHADFTGPIFESADLARIAEFLEAAAAGRPAPHSCAFTEPNLRFVRSADAGTSVRIRVGFALEWALPWVTPTDVHPAAGDPCTWIDLDVTPESLRAAAATARELMTLWPSRKHLFPRKASAKSLRKAKRREARRTQGASPPPAAAN